MDEKRLLARGQFEELKDQYAEKFIEIRATIQEIHRNLPVPDEFTKDLSGINTNSACTFLKKLPSLLEEYENTKNKLKGLSLQWALGFNGK